MTEFQNDVFVSYLRENKDLGRGGNKVRIY